MSRWDGKALLQPITAEEPCGQNLEDTPLLSSLDSWRLFGQPRPPETPLEPDEQRRLPDWDQIKTESLEALGRSKDLRLLAHLGAALLRTDGLPAFCETLTIASQWLQTYWPQTFPVVDEDAVPRRSALNCFADPMAIVDRVRRVPLVESRHGVFSLRDIDADPKPDQARVDAAFSDVPLDELMALQQSVAAAREALQAIDAKMREEAGPEGAPTFDPLSGQLLKLDRVLRAQLAARPDASAPAEALGAEPAGQTAGGQALGAIQSRQDAIRALDAVAAFFRQTEPSSPVPLFLDRAKRLVSKDFLEVLADIAPEALAQARAAGGLREE
jgi:type VI secretion system protein ImpA